MELPAARAEQHPRRRGGGGWTRVLGRNRAAKVVVSDALVCATTRADRLYGAGRVSVHWRTHDEHEKSTVWVLLGYLQRGVSERQVSLRGVCWLFTYAVSVEGAPPVAHKYPRKSIACVALY
jgi:hypothetical protein